MAAFESLFGDTTAASATLTETWRDETVTAMEVNSAQLAQLLDEDMEHAYLINTAHRIEVTGCMCPRTSTSQQVRSCRQL
mgnify:CR=1 FL=1